jgi:hypothetical protein
MLGESVASVVFPVLKLLYRLPDEEWLDTGGLLSSLGLGGPPDTSLLDVFVIESTTRLLKILSTSAQPMWTGEPRGGTPTKPPPCSSPIVRPHSRAIGCG